MLKTTKISPFISLNPCVLSGFFLFSQFSSQKRLLTAIARKASRSGKWRRKKMLDVNMFVTTPMRRVLLINSAPPSKKSGSPRSRRQNECERNNSCKWWELWSCVVWIEAHLLTSKSKKERKSKLRNYSRDRRRLSTTCWKLNSRTCWLDSSSQFCSGVQKLS